MAATELLARPSRRDLAAAMGGGVFSESAAFPGEPAAGYLDFISTTRWLWPAAATAREPQTKRLGAPLAWMSQPETQARRT
jgi:hypothetical protein